MCRSLFQGIKRGFFFNFDDVHLLLFRSEMLLTQYINCSLGIFRTNRYIYICLCICMSFFMFIIILRIFMDCSRMYHSCIPVCQCWECYLLVCVLLWGLLTYSLFLDKSLFNLRYVYTHLILLHL